MMVKLNLASRITKPLLLIIALIWAIFLRFYKLDQIPPGFALDEASHALDALDILNGKLVLISPRLTETPAGYMYLLAGAYQLFGVYPLVQRALTAVFGLLLVPASFFAVRALFKQELSQKSCWIAIFSALLLSTSFWAVTMSRIGYEYIFPPVFALLAVFFFSVGYHTKRWNSLIIASLFAAIPVYMYSGSVLFLLVIPASVLVNGLLRKIWPQSSPGEPGIQWRPLLFFLLLVAILITPQFFALISNTSPENERAQGLLIFNRAEEPAETLKLLSSSLLAHTEPFLALGGDQRWRSNVPDRPILDPLLAPFFVIGVLISFKRIRQFPYTFLLLYWALTLTLPILTFSNSPFYFRMCGALPPTYIFIAVAWVELDDWLKKYPVSLPQFQGLRTARPLAWLVFLLISLVWLPINTYRDYFEVWATHPEVARTQELDTFRLMERMERETDSEAIFILSKPQPPYERQPNYTLEFLYQGQAPLLYLPIDTGTIRQTLTSKLANYRFVHLITKVEMRNNNPERNPDPDGYLPFLLERYGSLINQEETEAYTILTYQLQSNRVDFEAHLRPGVPADLQQSSLTIAGQVKLAGFRQELREKDLSVDLAWQPLIRVPADYTVFVQLLNEQGERVAGIDILPEKGFSELDIMETTVSRYVIPLPGNIKPGRYSLLVGLYFLQGSEMTGIGSVILPDPVILPARISS